MTWDVPSAKAVKKNHKGTGFCSGIGLIEKVRRGLGKPDIIYVKNFSTISRNTEEKKA